MGRQLLDQQQAVTAVGARAPATPIRGPGRVRVGPCRPEDVRAGGPSGRQRAWQRPPGRRCCSTRIPGAAGAAGPLPNAATISPPLPPIPPALPSFLLRRSYTLIQPYSYLHLCAFSQPQDFCPRPPLCVVLAAPRLLQNRALRKSSALLLLTANPRPGWRRSAARAAAPCGEPSATQSTARRPASVVGCARLWRLFCSCLGSGSTVRSANRDNACFADSLEAKARARHRLES